METLFSKEILKNPLDKIPKVWYNKYSQEGEAPSRKSYGLSARLPKPQKKNKMPKTS